MKKNRRIVAVAAGIRLNHDIVEALTTTIETRLKISHSQEYVDQIMDQIKLSQEHCIEMGIDCTRNGIDQKMKENLWEARRMRGYE